MTPTPEEKKKALMLVGGCFGSLALWCLFMFYMLMPPMCVGRAPGPPPKRAESVVYDATEDDGYKHGHPVGAAIRKNNHLQQLSDSEADYWVDTQSAVIASAGKKGPRYASGFGRGLRDGIRGR